MPHSKSRPLGGKNNFTMKTISLFLDGLSGWSRAHNVLAPQHDPDWKVMIKAMRKVCNVRLDSNRPYKAAALCPVTVASLMSRIPTCVVLSWRERYCATLQQRIVPRNVLLDPYTPGRVNAHFFSAL